MIRAIRVGTVLNFKYDNMFSKAIGSVLGHYWTHSAVVSAIGNDSYTLVEAMGSYREDRYGTPNFIKRMRFVFKVKKLLGGKVISSNYSHTQIETLVKQNKCKVMNFGIIADSRFQEYIRGSIGLPYDYFNAFSIGLAKILTLFGKNFDENVKTRKKLFCSELVARMIGELTKVDILELTNKDSFEKITPQDISLAHNRLNIR